jgi:hypothetical protein
MKKVNRRICFILLLGVITALFLFSDFLHIEDSLTLELDCPMCMWVQQVLAIAKLYFLFVLIILKSLFRFQLANLGKVKELKLFNRYQGRAPPSSLFA